MRKVLILLIAVLIVTLAAVIISGAKQLRDREKVSHYSSRTFCIPFSRAEESVFQNFSKFERYSAYKVGNATIYAPDNILELFDLSEAKDVWYREEIYKTPRLYEFYLKELLRKEFKGDFSNEMKRELEIARKGTECQYLAELLSWIDKGMSTEEMINMTLERMEIAQEDEFINAYRYGILLVIVKNISPGRYSRASYNFVPSHGSKVIEGSYRAMLEEYSDQYNRMKIYLKELLRKEFKGDFSIDKGMSTEEMINMTLERMMVDRALLASSARYYGTYLMLDLISKNESYLLEYCNNDQSIPCLLRLRYGRNTTLHQAMISAELRIFHFGIIFNRV